MSVDVTILIPTFRRNAALARALGSARAQTGVGDVRIVVVDNDPDAGAREICASQGVNYVHCPQPGVANARNAGMAVVSTRYLGFLDDDQTARPDWLSRSCAVMSAHDAGVAHACIDAVFEPHVKDQDRLRPLFSRPITASGPTDTVYGAGGTVMDLTLCDLPDPAFDPDMNETGGEDDRFFGQLMETGTPFCTVADPLVTEHVPAERATLSYVTKRYFAFGQGPSQYAADRGWRGWPAVAFWMSVGAAQSVIRLPRFAWHRATRSPRALTSTAAMMEGLGKMFWWSSFKPKLYGAAMLRRSQG